MATLAHGTQKRRRSCVMQVNVTTDARVRIVLANPASTGFGMEGQLLMGEGETKKLISDLQAALKAIDPNDCPAREWIVGQPCSVCGKVHV